MVEENYFFRLSAYGDRLLEHYEAHPEAIEPETRRNEVLSTIRGGLQDFSISRTTFDWGIPVPWDPRHVCYVWFDALTNYITAAGYADAPERFARIWPANIHSIGKDILRFHAVYWPAMLMAAGVEPATQVWAHGYLTVGGKKMSKTNLTGIHPFQLIDHFGVDSYRYYFVRQITWGADGDFSWESMTDRHNADLANADDLPAVTADVVRRVDELMLDVQLQAALAAIWEIVDRANGYLVEKAPWKLAKDPVNAEELAGVLYAGTEVLRILAILIQPIMPSAAQRLWEQLGIGGDVVDRRLPADAAWGGLQPGTVTTKGDALFPRLDAE
jgi:methionyl-tRNA synthetase